MKKTEKIKPLFLIIAFVLCALGVFLGMGTTTIKENVCIEDQLNAAIRMADAEAYLKERILEAGIEIDFEDLNQTGLMGPEFTELTTTPGNTGAKRTSLNPNFAAAMVRYYTDAGLKKGDVVAIGTSGSFPGLMIAALCGATEMGLETRVIASLGSSMHGATRPEFNVFDILDHLKKGGFCEFDLLAVSPGSVNDLGGGNLEGLIYFGTKELSLELCKETGYEVIYIEDLAENIQYRLGLYGDDVDLFVNVGGASPNNGTSSYTLNFPNGLVLDPPTIPTTPYRGLIYEYAARGIPVINLLDVRGLAEANGIKYDSVPMEKPGESGVYYSVAYNIPLIIIFLVGSIGVLVFGWIWTKKNEK